MQRTSNVSHFAINRTGSRSNGMATIIGRAARILAGGALVYFLGTVVHACTVLGA